MTKEPARKRTAKSPSVSSQIFSWNDLWAVLKAAGTLSVAAFCISAATNAVVFSSAFGLNYFSLATISDVTLGGFIVAPFLIFIMGTAWLAWKLPKWFMRRNHTDKFAAWTGAAAGLTIGLIYLLITLQRVGGELSLSGAIVIASGGPPACEGGRVQWMGERNIIAQCEGTMTILRDPEAMTFRGPSK